MDDILDSEIISITSGERLEQGSDEESSGDEDGGLDWSKLLSGTARPVIPKRGEKDFEPAPDGGSGLQVHVLDRARLAMFDALKATRSTSSKSISYAVWCPELSRAHVTIARGIHFSTMGHSAPRSIFIEGKEKTQKRLELLPEEAIYLVERGALFCCKEINQPVPSIPSAEDIDGAPMSVQQTYSEMIGREDLTLEKYQVFAYLKRLGYAVTRTEPPASYYPTPPSFPVEKASTSIIQQFLSLLSALTSRILKFTMRRFDWWKPVQISHWPYHNKNYPSIFKSLRFIPSGHQIPLRSTKPISSPYQIFFNLYKPSTPFRKSAPPPPDFSVVVINARTTPMPSLHELTALFDVVPELPPPLPRERRNIPVNPTSKPPVPLAPPAVRKSFVRHVFPWAFPSPPASTPVRQTNPFMALKAGKKLVVIAVVDVGSISFFRFGQGVFTEWPMI